jgi:hypothetical protein
MRLTLHLQKHGFRKISKHFIFNQQQKVNESEANKYHAFINAFCVSGDFMRHLLLYISPLLFSMFFCILSYSQDDTSEVQAIKGYVSYVDSINNLGFQNNGFLHFVEDGVIAKKKGKISGGYGVYMLMNEKQDTAYRIEYNGGVNYTVNKTFYYRRNQIVFARFQLLDKRGTFYHREEFYRDNAILQTDVKESKKAGKHKKETTLALYEEGLKYFEDFKTTTSRR